jgi:hypothetical protein
MHPDNKKTGSETQFKQLKETSEQALKHFDNE